MEYGFGNVHGTETFRGACGLTGEQLIVENYEDCVITHRFTIKSVLAKRDKDCLYVIKDHSTVVDKSDAIKKQLQDTDDTADMAYVNAELALALIEETEE